MPSSQRKSGVIFACNRVSCPVTFTRRSDLHRHEKEKHRHAKMKCYQPGCRYRGTLRQGRLNKHLREKHSWLLQSKHRYFCQNAKDNTDPMSGVALSPTETTDDQLFAFERSSTTDSAELQVLEYQLPQSNTATTSNSGIEKINYRDNQFTNDNYTSDLAFRPYCSPIQSIREEYGFQPAFCHYKTPLMSYQSLGHQQPFPDSAFIEQSSMQITDPAGIVVPSVESGYWVSVPEVVGPACNFKDFSWILNQSPEGLETMAYTDPYFQDCSSDC